MKLKTIILAAILFSALLSGCISGEEPQKQINHIVVGDNVPDFSLDNGAFVSPDGFNGKASIIILFNTGCSDCKREMPKVYAAWKDIIQHFDACQVIAIGRDQTRSELEKEWTYEGMPYYTDPQRTIFNKFANMTIPRIYFVDDKGIVKHMWIETLETESGEPITADEFKNLFLDFKNTIMPGG